MKMIVKKIWEKIEHPFSRPKLTEAIFLVSIFVVSFLFRRIGLKFGFPLLTHPDEPVILDVVYHMTTNRTLESENLIRPDLILYMLNFIYLNVLSLFKFGKTLAYTFLDNKLIFYYHARLLIAVIGSLIPIIAYKIGKEFEINISIPAALLFAFFPLYVSHSHYVTPDVPITLFTLLVILFSVRYVNKKENKNIYLATIFAAINTAEKYPGLLSFGIVVVAIFLRAIKQKSARIKMDYGEFFIVLLQNTGVYLISLYLVAPILFIEYGKVIDALISESRTTHLGADNLSWGGNILFYIEQFILASNPLILLFIFAGIFCYIKVRNKLGILLLYGFAYWVLLSKLGLHWVRWALPMYTAPILLTSVGMAYSWVNLKNKKIIKYLLIIFFSITIFQQMITSLSNSARMGFIDTRVIALDYCNRNGIAAENSIYEGYTPLLPQYAKIIVNEDLDDENDKVKHIVLSSYMYRRYFDEPNRYANEINFYQEIERNQELMEQFAPTPIPTNLRGKIDNIVYYFLRYFNTTRNDRYTGPIIKIFRIIE